MHRGQVGEELGRKQETVSAGLLRRSWLDYRESCVGIGDVECPPALSAIGGTSEISLADATMLRPQLLTALTALSGAQLHTGTMADLVSVSEAFEEIVRWCP